MAAQWQCADLRYPKPGTPNPLVTVHTFSLADYQRTKTASSSVKELKWPGMLDPEIRIITEVNWVANDALLVKETDRAARVGHVVLFRGGENEGVVVRQLGKNGEEGDDGWIEHVSIEDVSRHMPDTLQGQNVRPLKGASVEGYVDIVPNNGFNHLAFFSPLNSSVPIWLTEGEWEVTNIAGVDGARGLM